MPLNNSFNDNKHAYRSTKSAFLYTLTSPSLFHGPSQLYISIQLLGLPL